MKRLAFATSLSSVGFGMSLLLVSWLGFQSTGSATVVGLVWAARLAPLVLLGVPAGAACDRYGPTRVARVTGSTVPLAASAILITIDSVAGVLAASALLGAGEAARMVAGPRIAMELSPSAAGRAVALLTLVGGIGTTLASVAGTVILGAGVLTPSVLMAACYVLGALVLPTVAVPQHSHASGFARSVGDGLALVRRYPLVRLLVFTGIAAEMLGFSVISVEPILAGNVWGAGAAGLAVLASARSLGRLLLSVALSIRSVATDRAGLLIAIGVTAFGMGLAAIAVSPSVAWAVPGALIVGASGGVVDIVLQVAVQTKVPDEARGRAAGLWVFSLGFGPIGGIELGVVADLVGAPLALGVHSAALLGIGAFLAGSPRRALDAAPASFGGIEKDPAAID